MTLEKLKQSGSEYTSAEGRPMKAWSTSKGGVMLDLSTNEITVLVGDDGLFGCSDLDKALSFLL